MDEEILSREELRGIKDQFLKYIELAKNLISDNKLDGATVISWMKCPYEVLMVEDEELRKIAGLLHLSTQILINNKILSASLQPTSEQRMLYDIVGYSDSEVILAKQHNGYTLKYYYDIIKQEVTKVDISDALSKMGIDDMKKFLSTDEGLDLINQYQKDFPDQPLFGENGLMNLYKDCI